MVGQVLFYASLVLDAAHILRYVVRFLDEVEHKAVGTAVLPFWQQRLRHLVERYHHLPLGLPLDDADGRDAVHVLDVAPSEVLHVAKAKPGHGRQAERQLYGSLVLAFGLHRQEASEFIGRKILPMLVGSMETFLLGEAMHRIEGYQLVTDSLVEHRLHRLLKEKQRVGSQLATASLDLPFVAVLVAHIVEQTADFILPDILQQDVRLVCPFQIGGNALADKLLVLHHLLAVAALP